MSDGSTQVHVWAPPGEKLGFDERKCTDRDHGEGLIFHVSPRTFTNGDRMCMACASIFWPFGKQQQDKR